MAAFLDGCRFNPAAGGTADWTYSSVVTGYQSPAAANVVNGRLYKYRAESADLSQWEFGEGAYNTGTGVLARTTILYTSSGTTSKINFSAVPQVAIVALKEDLISVEEANAFTTAQKQQACSNIGVTTVGQASAGQIPGIAGATVPTAGNIGEVISMSGSLAFSGSGVAGQTSAATLTPGVWDIDGCATFGGPGATTSYDYTVSLGLTSASVSSGQLAVFHERLGTAAPSGDMAVIITIPRTRITVTTSTAYYFNAAAIYTGGGGYGMSLSARATRAS